MATKFKINDEVIYNGNLCKITDIFKNEIGLSIIDYNTGNWLYVDELSLVSVIKKKKFLNKNVNDINKIDKI